MHNIIDGLEIILDNEPDAHFYAEHDMIHAGKNADSYNEEDTLELQHLGWVIEDSSWTLYV